MTKSLTNLRRMGVKNREKGVKKAKYGEFLKLNMGKNTILRFSPHIKEACLSLIEFENSVRLIMNLIFLFCRVLKGCVTVPAITCRVNWTEKTSLTMRRTMIPMPSMTPYRSLISSNTSPTFYALSAANLISFRAFFHILTAKKNKF